MFYLAKCCDVCYSMNARYNAMMVNKERGDALNVCRVSPREHP